MLMIEAQKRKKELQCPHIHCEDPGTINRTNMIALEK